MRRFFTRSPRLRTALLVVLLAGPVAPAFAQDALEFAPRTGDAWVDGRLADINQYGRAYRDPFVDELVRYHGAPRDLVLELLTRRGWPPGDVYFACALAAQLGRPCRAIVDEYERDRGEGWGALAKRLGIQPGSARFHALKKGFVPAYDRWARPLQIDPDLARDFPGRRVAPVAHNDKDGKDDDRGALPVAHDASPRGPKAAPAAGKAKDAGRPGGRQDAGDGKAGKGQSKGKGKGGG